MCSRQGEEHYVNQMMELGWYFLCCRCECTVSKCQLLGTPGQTYASHLVSCLVTLQQNVRLILYPSRFVKWTGVTPQTPIMPIITIKEL